MRYRHERSGEQKRRTMEEKMAATIKPSFHHVTLKTTRLPQMVEWYKTLVGIEVLFQDDSNAWTSNDEANHRLAFLTVPGLEDDPDRVKHNGIHHSAFEYGSFSDLMSSFDRLRDIGIMPVCCLNHESTMSLYYEDPEGNLLELQSDNFGDWKQSSNFIRTSDDFRANPICTFFDPAKVYEAHIAGQPFDLLNPSIRKGGFLPDRIPGIGLPEK